jgi:CoA:oxalate CoA-transferase
MIKVEKALTGIRIIDLTQHLAGPFCTMLLADMGAEVIKVEPPWGDATRENTSYPVVKGESSYFMFPNRNKKSIVLDLKNPKGVEALKRLVETSDILVENFRPGVMERLGVGYEELNRANPQLVYASITGFGSTGPYAKRPSYDIISQAMSGWMWLNSRERRGPNSQPTFTPSCLAGSPGDTIPGLFCALGVLAALNYRTRTGRGQRVEVAQMDALITTIGLALTRYLFTGETSDEKARERNRTIHGVYETRDGFVAVRAATERDLKSLAETIGVETQSLSAESPALVNWFKERTKTQVSKLLSDQIPCAPVQTEEEMVKDTNVRDRDMIVERPHPKGFRYRAVATGIKFSETPVDVNTLPPNLGQDTFTILKSIGYTENEIRNLSKDKEHEG